MDSRAFMTTKPSAAARKCHWTLGHRFSPVGRTDLTREWDTCTLFTSPYREKCKRSWLEEAKPSLLILRTMKTHAGSSRERACSCDFMVSGAACCLPGISDWA